MKKPPPRCTIQLAVAQACELTTEETAERFGIDKGNIRNCYRRHRECIDTYAMVIRESLPLPDDVPTLLVKPDFTIDYPLNLISDFNVQLAIGTIASIHMPDYERTLNLKPSAVSQHRSRHYKLYDNALESAMLACFQTVGEMIPIFRMYSVNDQSELSIRYKELTTPRPEQMSESNSRLYRYKYLFAEQLRLGADEAHNAGQVLGILLTNRALDKQFTSTHKEIYHV